MKNHDGLKKNFLIVGFFIFAPFVFFYDTATMRGIIGELDGLIYLFPYRLFSYRQWLLGDMPLWNPYLLCGYPLLAALQPGVLYFPGLLLFFLFSPVAAFNVTVLLHFSLAGLFTYLYMRTLQVSAMAALMAGIAFMFCGFLMQWANNAAIQNSAVWLPAILFFMEKATGGRKFKYVFCAACCFAMCILAGYPQVLLCTAMVVLCYALYLAFCARSNRATVAFHGLSILVLGSLLGAVQLLPTMELAGASIREIYSPEHFMVPLTSFKLKYILLFFFPYLFGSLNPGFYPGYYVAASPFRYLFEGVCYMGILTMLLAGTAVLKRRRGDRITVFWLCIAAGTCIILLGNHTPLFPFIFKTFFLSRFYNIAINMYVLNFAAAILCGLGLDSIIRHGGNGPEATKRLAVRLSALTLLAALLIVLRPSLIPQIWHYLRTAAGTGFSNPAIFIPIACMTASACVYGLLLARPARQSVQALAAVVLCLDLFFFGHFLHERSINVDALLHEEHYPPVVRFLRQAEPDPHAYRVYPLVSALSEVKDFDFVIHNINMLYPVSSIVGYDPLYLKKHFALLQPESRTGTFKNPGLLASNNRIISLLNVKYLVAYPQYRSVIESVRAAVVPGSSRVVPLLPGSLGPHDQVAETVPLYSRVFESPDGVTVYRNRNALARAYLVDTVRPVKDFDAAARTLCDLQAAFDPGREALVERPGPDAPGDLTSGTARVISYKAREVTVETQSGGHSFLVFSDTWYPGWKAFVDGSETTLYVTNGIVRGVFVPPGIHEVAFTYRPRSFMAGAAISLMTLCASLFGIIIFGVRKKRSVRGGP